jgi:hypothetical protein
MMICQRQDGGLMMGECVLTGLEEAWTLALIGLNVHGL